MSSLADQDPKGWGPVYWRMLAHMVNAYPLSNPSESLQTSSSSFFESLGELLPCQECREHYIDWIASNPVKESLSGQRELSDWVTLMKQAMPGNQKKRAITTEDELQARAASTNPKSITSLRLQAQKRLRQKPRSDPRGSTAAQLQQRNQTRRHLPTVRSTVRSTGKKGCNCAERNHKQ